MWLQAFHILKFHEPGVVVAQARPGGPEKRIEIYKLAAEERLPATAILQKLEHSVTTRPADAKFSFHQVWTTIFKLVKKK
jgi:hypothetical protein